jgi:16S rRNA processing protein RimM
MRAIKGAMSKPEKSPHEKPRRILVGEITGAHGIRGDVLVRTYTETPGAITTYGPLTDADGRKSFTLRIVRITSKGVVARVGGIEDRNGAEPLRGTKLYVDRAALPATSETEFYHADLIGLRAVAVDGAALGEIVSVQNFGAGDLLELRLLDGTGTEFIPFENRWVPSVDLGAGVLVISRPVESIVDDDDEMSNEQEPET